LTRASIFFAKSFYEDGWIAGSSPAMTAWMDARGVSFCPRFARPAPPSERNQQVCEMTAGAISLFPIVLYNEFCNSHVSVAFERSNSLHTDVVERAHAARCVVV
jgi:hypothetical protein